MNNVSLSKKALLIAAVLAIVPLQVPQVFACGPAMDLKSSYQPVGCYREQPSPKIRFTGKEAKTVNGKKYTYYYLSVTNRSLFSDALFRAAPRLPACGLNTNSSRTWVNIYINGRTVPVYGFCALNKADQMNELWFAVSAGDKVKVSSIQITLEDRKCGKTYYSNKVKLQ